MWRVLVVDDSALIRSSMASVLEPYGIEVGQAENGKIAVDHATASSWDLIFLDVVMPVMDGPTALREIRARGNTTPVVLVTSVSTATVVAGAVKLGGVHYIAKPFTRDQIRAVATKLLKLDPHALTHPPRVVLQHVDPDLPGQLRRLLPAHVAIDTTTALAQSLELIETAPRELVIIESRELGDEMIAVASVLRRSLPAAGIFAITDDPEVPLGWHPTEGLDGFLPRALDDALVRGFLVPCFLRPLVMLDGMVARVAGPRGAPSHLRSQLPSQLPSQVPSHLPAYVGMLARVLVERCARLDGTSDLQIDLQRMPDDPDAIVQVITVVNQALREAGLAPAFQISPAMQAATTGRLGRAVII
ncbi:MAG TPA: response regulator [Kofleriaceae bacterium]|nr:response regulator [Kofleriaceae bacterium]